MYACKMLHYAQSYSKDPLLTTDLRGLTLLRRGKDKDIYDLGDMLLIVATDRLSIGGKSLEQGFRGKGRIVNQLSAFWFRHLAKIIPNHLVSADERCFPETIRSGAESAPGRSMLVWETTPLPVRCVVRGYLAGAGWLEYQEKGEICGVKLPAGLAESQRLPSPIFTPTTKGSHGEMNENIDYSSLESHLGKTLAEKLRDISLKLYFNAWMSARDRGVLIADTKFEFGLHAGQLMLIDECLTPDNSRFWELDKYRHGGKMPSLDKHLLIDYLSLLDSDDGTPHVPEEMLSRLGQNYLEVYRRVVRGRLNNYSEDFSAGIFEPRHEIQLHRT